MVFFLLFRVCEGESRGARRTFPRSAFPAQSHGSRPRLFVSARRPPAAAPPSQPQLCGEGFSERHFNFGKKRKPVKPQQNDPSQVNAAVRHGADRVPSRPAPPAGGRSSLSWPVRRRSVCGREGFPACPAPP